MKNKLLLTLLSVFLSMTYSYAQLSKTIDVTTPGTLSEYLGVDKTKVTELVLTGTINDADFTTIKQMSLLKTLDMLNVNIVNGMIPGGAFQGRVMEKIVLPSSLKIIGGNAFSYMSISLLDFSSCVNLEEIGSTCFVGFKTPSQSLDFSECTSLTRFIRTNLGIGPGTFTNHSGHVILPKNLLTLPASSFLNFRGTVDFSETLENIGSAAFQGAVLTDTLSLPSSLKKIGPNVFSGTTVPYLDFSECQSLEEIGSTCFVGFKTPSQSLDFSECTSLTRFIRTNLGIGPGTFTNHSGHVILPKNLIILPVSSFLRFTGSVELSPILETIQRDAFNSSVINNITLPSTVKFLDTQAFAYSSKLERITSLNPTPPALGVNVFNGVNKASCKLIVPEGSVHLYAAAAQWKDFLIEEVPDPIPSKIDLTYKIGIGHINWENINTDVNGVLEVAYEGIRIGEYYWMNKNFNHHEPKRIRWTAILSGEENDYPMTQQYLDKYLDQVHLTKSDFQVDVAQFTKDYGVYYNKFTRDYMSQWGRMYENGSREKANWILPRLSDFRQLIGMCPFNTKVSQVHEDLNPLDVIHCLAPRPEANPMSGYIVSGQHGSTYWFGNNNNNKDYGFDMMPNGARINGDGGTWTTELGGIKQYFTANKGDIYHLFYTTKLAAQGDYGFSLHDQVDTQPQENYHWVNMRWCRRLTDEELGYKLYIKIANLSETSNEWQNLKNGNEIPLLLTMRGGNLTPAETTIIKTGLTEAPPTGYIDLPNGYIRGFYVQYILNKSTSVVTIHKVMQYAYSVQDGVLGFNIGASSNPIAIYPENTLRVAAIESTENVIENAIRVYPNPVTDILYLDSSEVISEVRIYSLTGKVVLQQTNVGSSVEVNHLAKGTYILKLQVGDKSYTHKIIKK